MMQWFCKFQILPKKEKKPSEVGVGAVAVENPQTEGHTLSSVVPLLAHVRHCGFREELRFFRLSYNFTPESILHSVSLWLAYFLGVCDKPHQKSADLSFCKEFSCSSTFFWWATTSQQSGLLDFSAEILAAHISYCINIQTLWGFGWSHCRSLFWKKAS